MQDAMSAPIGQQNGHLNYIDPVRTYPKASKKNKPIKKVIIIIILRVLY